MRRYSGILWGILLIGVLMTVTNPRIKHVDPGKYLDYAEYYSDTGHTVDYALVRTATYVVAAAAGPNTWTAQSDYQCDGTQDDVEMQAAVDAAYAAGGGTVLLGPGTFSPSASVEPKDKVSIIGQGIGVTTISFDHSVCDDAFMSTDDLSDVTIGRMTIIDTLGTPVQSWGISMGGWTDGAATLANIQVYEVECEECGIWLANVESGQYMVRNCYVHDLTAGDGAIRLNWGATATVKENTIDTCYEMGVGIVGVGGVTVSANSIINTSAGTSAYAIDTGESIYVTVSDNYIYAPRGINSEDSAGPVTIRGNMVRGEGTDAGVGIQVWRTATSESQGSKIIIAENNISSTNVGIAVYDESDASITGNKVYTIGTSGIYVKNTSGWTASRYHLIALNDIYDHADVTAYSAGVRVGGTGGMDYVDIVNNNIDGNSNTNARGVYWENTTTAPNSRIIGNTFKGIATQSNRIVGEVSDMYIRENIGHIAPGEIRTLNGSISTLTENAYNSVDNPFGQNVLVLDETIYISTKATSGAPRLDCGIGSSATTDYTTVFDDITCETVGPYHSVNTATIGKQTSPILWQTGTGNRYFNHSIKAAAATGMVAIYSIRVMGV